MDNFEDIYNKLYNELNNNIIEKDLNKIIEEYQVVDIDDVDNIYLDSDYVIINYVEEDKLDDHIETLGYNIVRDSILAFNTQIYLKEILKSYHYKAEEIWYQFDLDCSRCKLYLDDDVITNSSDLKLKLDQFKNNIITIDNTNFNILTIIAMLCNQSSYAFPYVLCHKILSDIKKNIFISNLSSNRYVKIKIKESSIDISIEADFGLRDIEKNKVISKINIILLISMNIVDGNYVFNKNSLLIWDKKY